MGNEADEVAVRFQERLGDPRTAAVAIVDGDAAEIAVIPVENTDRRFEIGSVGKTFTATLLACQVICGTIRFEDEIGRWLDAGANAQVTVGELARHISGLPRLAPNASTWKGFHADRPYDGYTAALAEYGLRATKPTSPGEFEYSNFGYQLLGIILERVTSMPLAELAHRDLFEPLGMTSASLNGTHTEALPGYSGPKPVPRWCLDLPGPGGFAATIADMAAYTRGVLEPPPGVLGDAIRLAIGPDPIAWARGPGARLWHNGGTAGFHSILIISPKEQAGYVALANDGTAGWLDGALNLVADHVVPDNDQSPTMLEIAQLVVDRAWDDLRSRMNDRCRNELTVERLDPVWQQAVKPLGTRVSVHHRASWRRPDNWTTGDLTVSSRKGNRTVMILLDTTGKLAGLQIS